MNEKYFDLSRVSICDSGLVELASKDLEEVAGGFPVDYYDDEFGTNKEDCTNNRLCSGETNLKTCTNKGCVPP